MTAEPSGRPTPTGNEDEEGRHPKGAAQPSTFWKRNKDKLLVAALAAVVAAVVGPAVSRIAIPWVETVTKASLQDNPKRIDELENVDDDLEKMDESLSDSIAALKCHIKDEEWKAFLARCAESGSPPDFLPEVACRIDGEIISFRDPLPQIDADCD